MGIISESMNKARTKKERDAAEQAAFAANTQTPAGYESRYAGAIESALGALGDRSVADVTGNGGQAAKDKAAAWAQDAAQHATAGTQAIGGGYGTDYAAAAAQQTAARMQEGAVGAELADYQRALAAYNADTAGKRAALAGLMGQEQTDLGRFADAQADRRNWQNFVNGMQQTAVANDQQAEQDRQNAWQNAVNAMKWMISTGMNAYDTYKGYKQQEWENGFRERQYQDSLSQYADSQARYNSQQMDTWMAAAQAAYEKGDTGTAGYYLKQAGLPEDFFANYDTGPRYDIYKLASQAATLQSSGMKDAADAYLKQYGYDSSLLKGLMTGAAGGGGSGGSGGGGGGTGGLSLSQMGTVYSNYNKALSAGDQQGAAMWGAMLGLDPGTVQQTGPQLYGNGLGVSDYISAAKALEGADPNGASYGYLQGLLEAPKQDTAQNARMERGYSMAADWKKSGVDQTTVAKRLMTQGLTTDEIQNVLYKAGY